MSDIAAFWLDSLPQLLAGLSISLQVTGAALAIGFPLGLLLALGVQSKVKAVKLPSLCLVEIGRGAPALVVLQFAYFGLPQGGLTLSAFAAAVFALAWNTGAYTSEIIRAGLESVPFGEIEAASAMGMLPRDTLRFVIIPQGLRVAAPALLGFAVAVLQATSLCFAIALPELTSNAYMIGTITFRYMEILSLAGILYAAICVPATIAVGVLEQRLGKHAL
ncbi:MULTISPECIES: amino acid ABC transporter permease [Mesorhizobium]|uniref:Amino acid ABC transporter permease n=1 Tax=Mesorhizobium denitrificans TaxID=2294114 RepID=A0A371XEK7_9HYPH|nr:MULTISPECIES: amino acid ABC transporter permease [Mesorhizobium]RFC67648.1 amino acid ABC transporter permease [Mesorhizobium denitrificans]